MGTLENGDRAQFHPSASSFLPPQCPVYDLDNNVAFIGMYQTMTKKAAITVQVGNARALLGDRRGWLLK